MKKRHDIIANINKPNDITFICNNKKCCQRITLPTFLYIKMYFCPFCGKRINHTFELAPKLKFVLFPKIMDNVNNNTACDDKNKELERRHALEK